MSHKNYPTTYCPLSGQQCLHKKTTHITEKNKKDSVSFSMCQICSGHWHENIKNGYTDIKDPQKQQIPNLLSLPNAIKELADVIFGKPIAPQIDLYSMATQKKSPQAGFIHSLPIKPIEDIAPIKPIEDIAPLSCSKCSLDLRTMLKKGRLGCSECYATFKNQLANIIMNYHGSTKHKGKVPKNHENHELKELFTNQEILQYKLSSLKEEQQEAIKIEAYERAGELAALIKEIENKLNEASSNDECSSPHDSSLPPEKDEDQ